MKKLAFLGTALLAVVFSGCGDVIKYSKLAKELATTQTYNNKPIDVVGTIEIPLLVFETGDNKKKDVMLSVSAGAEVPKITNIKLNYGKDIKNGYYVDLPEGQEKFTAKDFVLYDKNGKKISLGNVRVQGIVKYGTNGLKPNEYSVEDVVIETAE